MTKLYSATEVFRWYEHNTPPEKKERKVPLNYSTGLNKTQTMKSNFDSHNEWTRKWWEKSSFFCLCNMIVQLMCAHCCCCCYCHWWQEYRQIISCPILYSVIHICVFTSEMNQDLPVRFFFSLISFECKRECWNQRTQEEEGYFFSHLSTLFAISFNIAIMVWMPFIVLFISFNDKEIAFHSASFGIQNSFTFFTDFNFSVIMQYCNSA